MPFGSCDTECPFAKDCTCIYVIKTEEPHCSCSDKVIILPPLKLKAEDEVNFSVRDTDLGEVAAVVQKLTDAEVLVPIARMREYVSTTIAEVPLAEAVESVGLSLGRPRSAS